MSWLICGQVQGPLVNGIGAELSETNRTMMYIRKVSAHGFVSLKGNSEILYFVSEFYSPAHEGSLSGTILYMVYCGQLSPW